ncbi:MAG: N-acetylmuramic acid 6-phosphate etherase [Phycisphaerae bacterium]|nr:N-acetylmuramic acid 6-phosphate etherase [Phycisphaerae bacterium]
MKQPMARALPPDRSHVGTEQRHPGSMEFDARSVQECIEVLAGDQQRAIDAVLAAAPSIAAFVTALLPRMLAGGRLLYAGAGTSGRLGVLDASECPPTFRSRADQIIGVIAGGDAALRTSSERMEDDPRGIAAEFDRLGIGANDAVVGIAAGGTTPYPRGAVTMAKERGALTAFLVCAPCDAPAGCDHLLLIDTGPEVITGSTRLKAGTATKLALNCITTTLFTKLGKVHGNLMVDLAATNDKLVDRAVRIMRTFHPELSREQGAVLLEAAGGSLKIALVMHANGLDRAAAQARLDAAHGVLRAAIER